MIQNIQSTDGEESDGKEISQISLPTIFLTFFLIGCTSFGGGVAAYIRRVVVEEKCWIDDVRFFRGFSLAQVAPGPNSANSAIFIGRYLRGGWGSLVAIFAVLLPGIVVLSILSFVLANAYSIPQVEGVLDGVGACAVGLIASMAFQMREKVPLLFIDYLMVVGIFIAVGIFRVPITVIILIGVPISLWIHRPVKTAESEVNHDTSP